MQDWSFTSVQSIRTVEGVEHLICVGCGVQHEASATPPVTCMVCSDDRQYVAEGGQRWTTHAALAASSRNRIERDVDLLGIGFEERFAIPQRALLATSDVNVLWDCVSLVSPAAVDAVNELGGLDAIAISHPHFYASMVEWSDAFGGVPIFLHEADEPWVQRRSPNIQWWSGDDLELSPSLRLLHLPGHFPGSTGLHWSDGPNGDPVLLAGDSLHVADDRRHVTVMHSVPNFVPVSSHVIRDLRARLAGVTFGDLYGFTWGRNVIGDARAAVDRSFDRYLDHLSAPATSTTQLIG